MVLEERRRHRELRFLEKCAKPLEFEGSGGEVIRVETPSAARARELHAVYTSLNDEQVRLRRPETPGRRFEHRPRYDFYAEVKLKA